MTATSVDGSAMDLFTVNAIGELSIDSITPTSLVAVATATYVFVVTLESNVYTDGGDGAYITFDFPDSFGVTAGTQVTSISPSVPNGFTSNNVPASSSVYYIGLATVPAGTYTLTIEGITNPLTAGAPGAVLVDTRNGGSEIYDTGVATAPEILPAGPIFTDGFETGNTSSWSVTWP